jgi:hypothetical protein
MYLLLFHGNSVYTNAPNCCVIRTLSVLFVFVNVIPSLLVFFYFSSLANCVVFRVSVRLALFLNIEVIL